jgi:hypothetical protein
MHARDILIELYDRVPPVVHAAADGLGEGELTRTPGGANSVGWLLWHLTRVQDHHVAQLIGIEQLWQSGGWAASFGLEPDPENTGYGHTQDDVAAVRPRDAQAVVDYHDAVAARTRDYLEQVSDRDLDDVVDRSFDPPVTRGARLVSVAVDDLQHAGQAAYSRGMVRDTD